MADQACTSLHPQLEVQHPPALIRAAGAGELEGGEAATVLALRHLHTAEDISSRRPRRGQFVKDEQGEGRRGGLSQRPHKPPPRCRESPQSPWCTDPSPAPEPWGRGGGTSHLGVQDRAEFQSHCVIAERLSREREHTVQEPHLESIWAPLPTGESAQEARACGVGRPGVGPGLCCSLSGGQGSQLTSWVPDGVRPPKALGTIPPSIPAP